VSLGPCAREQADRRPELANHHEGRGHSKDDQEGSEPRDGPADSDRAKRRSADPEDEGEAKPAPLNSAKVSAISYRRTPSSWRDSNRTTAQPGKRRQRRIPSRPIGLS